MAEDVNAEHSSFLNKKIKRRALVGGGAVAVSGAVINIATNNSLVKRAEAFFSRFGSDKPQEEGIKIEPMGFEPVPEIDIKWIYPPGHEGDDSAVKVAVNSDGLPVKYVLPGGKEVPFNLNIVSKVREAAISNSDPQIIDIFQIPTDYKFKHDLENKFDTYNSTPEHPKTETLPEDALTEEELKEHGISIIQGNETKLFVRRGAFSKDAPLEAFADGNRKIKMVLIDGPVVSADLLQAKKYDAVRGLLTDKSKTIGEFREAKIKEATRAVELYEDELDKIKTGRKSLFDARYLNAKLIQNKSLLIQYETSIISDGQLYLERAVEKGEQSDVLGEYFAPTKDHDATIFLAVGDVGFDTDVVTFAFTNNGEFWVTQLDGFLRNNSGSGKDFSPKLSQTHPNPDDFSLNLDASPDDPHSYPYAGQTTGFNLEHEVAHDKLIEGSKDPNYSEYDTDMLAMTRIRRAWKKWKDSNFTDNSGYSFVFKLSNGDYIFTKDKSVSASKDSA